MNPFKNRAAQSIVEYVVVLALIGILIVTVIRGVGSRSQAKMAQVNEGFDESAVAGATGATPTQTGGGRLGSQGKKTGN